MGFKGKNMYINNNTTNIDLVPINCFTVSSYAAYIEAEADDFTKEWLLNNDFKAKSGSYCKVPTKEGKIGEVISIVSDDDNCFWDAGALASKLPQANYEFRRGVKAEHEFLTALAWGLASYKFTAFKKSSVNFPSLKLHESIDSNSLKEFVNTIYQVRNLINLPANALGPENIAQEVAAVAQLYKASFKQTIGADLLAQNFPAIHTVGRASVREPRLIELAWGPDDGFKLALVGKGVCFDSGGLDIKPAAGMRDMKKDMGGAAHALGLARMIMAHNLPISLRLYIPAVDNVIAGNAYMPGDILETRAGITVENDNTDAEGRLILSDALYLACEAKPDLLIDFATLTGAARVGLGPDIPAMFSNSKEVADAVISSSEKVHDPVWPMPLFPAYNKFIESKLADVRSCGSCCYGGAITAALFLQKFVAKDVSWLHFDIMAANTRDLPGRPEGGEAMGLRSLFNYIQGLVAS